MSDEFYNHDKEGSVLTSLILLIVFMLGCFVVARIHEPSQAIGADKAKGRLATREKIDSAADSKLAGNSVINKEKKIINNDFKNINTKFANPRNAASGSLRQKNPDETKKIPLKFIAYTFGYENGMQLSTQSEFLKKLKEWGFKVNPLNRKFKKIKDLMDNYNVIEKLRGDLDFDIDGIVYKINDFQLQKRLGFAANAPRWAVAHKFSSNKSISEILNIEIQIGNKCCVTVPNSSHKVRTRLRTRSCRSGTHKVRPTLCRTQCAHKVGQSLIVPAGAAHKVAQGFPRP